MGLSITNPTIAAIIAGTTLASAASVSFANSNGVSFGVSGDTITASVVGGGGAQGSISAGTTSAALGQVVFSNSNGMSFGLNGSTVTGSYTVPSTAGLISGINVSGGTTSNNLSAVTFSNANNVSFGLNGSTLTASASYSQSTAPGGIAAGGVTATSGTVVLSNLNGISFGLNAGTITASYTVPSTAGHLSAVNISAGTTSNNASAFVFSNSNNVSFGLNGSTITATITVPAQSAQTQSNIAGIYDGANSISTGTIRFTNANGVSFSINGQTISGSVAAQTAQTQSNVQGISAGTQVGRTGDVVFSNSNGIAFGMAGSATVTASYTVPAAGSISAGTTSASLGQVVFSNSNGISFGMNGNTITATVNPGAAAGIAAIQGGTQTATSGTVVFSDSNGISFGLSGSTRITASYTVPSTAGLISGVNLSAGTTSNNLTAFVFSNSNNVSFGLNGSTVTATITVPAQTAQSMGMYALGNTTQNSSTTLDARTLSLNGLGAATVGYSNGSIQISVPVQTAQTQSNIAGIYDGANSISTGTIRFSNLNGVSFGVNGQTLTASVLAQTAQTQNVVVPSAGTQTATSGTAIFSNSNGISFGMSGSATITASYTVPSTAGLLSAINLSAGTTSGNLSAVTFSNLNGISFGLNSSTITASYTVPTQTNQTEGLYALGNTTGQSSSSTFDARTLSISGAGIISVGMSGNALVISATGAGGGLTNINLSAGTTSNNLSAFVFSNSNNVSFGLNGSTVTATITVPAQTNQTIGGYFLSNTTGESSSSSFDARSMSFKAFGAISAGMSGGTVLLSVPAVVAQTVQTQSLIAGVYDGANSISTGTIRFTNANGVSFSINGQTISGSVAAQTNQSIGIYGVGNTTQSSSGTLDARSMSFQGAGIASVGYTNGSVVISVPTGAPSPVNFSAGTTSSNLGSVVFSNSNGVSFGLDGATITASAAGGGPMSLYALGNTTQNSSTTLSSLSFNALGAMTWGYSNGSIQVSAPPTSSLSATGLLSISTNGSTISIGVAERTWSNWEPYPMALMMTGSSTSAHNTGSAWIDRIVLPTAVAVSNANFVKTMGISVPAGTAGATSGVVRVSYQQLMTIFSRQNFGTGSTNLSSVTSASFGFTAGLSFTSTAQTASISWVTDSTGGTTSFSTTSNAANWSSYWTGMKMWQIPLVTTLSAGEYFFAHAQSSTTASTNTGGVLFNTIGNVCFLGQRSAFSVGTITSAGVIASSNYVGAGMGVISTQGLVTTSTMAMSAISFLTNATNNAWYFNLSNA